MGGMLDDQLGRVQVETWDETHKVISWTLELCKPNLSTTQTYTIGSEGEHKHDHFRLDCVVLQ